MGIVARHANESIAKAVDMTLCVPQSLDNAKRVAHMPTAGAEDTEGGTIRFEKTLSGRGFK
jgi:hypothetical protein